MNHFKAMNTDFFTFGVDQQATDKVKSWVRLVESRLSRFSAESELSQLNQSHGKIFVGSELLWETVQLARHYFEETGGIFNPFLGETLNQLGYNHSFENIDHPEIDWSQFYQPSLKQRKLPLSYDPIQKSLQLDQGVSVDLGGLGKGWSIQKIKEWLSEEGHHVGIIDGGGDMAIWGEPTDGPWCISVADPYDSKQDVAAFWARGDFAVATSSTLKRKWSDSKGGSHHHIIDPRIHLPSRSDLVQVTLFAPDVPLAEVYAKCFIILGRAGWNWIKGKHPELAYIAVTDSKEVIMSDNIMDYCRNVEL